MKIITVKNKKTRRKKRQKRLRVKIKGTAKQPRLSIFRSNKHISAQLIDDEKRKTLLHASDLEIKDRKKMRKTDLARKVGKLVAGKSLEKKIKKIVFDRAGYKYHGRVKAVADGAREGGLEF